MPPADAPFDLSVAFNAVLQALGIVVCNIGFGFAVHGLAVAIIVGAIGLHGLKTGKRSGKPLLAVFRKVALFCLVLAIPGVICLLASGHLPPVGQLKINSIGFLGFWGLVISHLCMEEMNYQWFPNKGTSQNS